MENRESRADFTFAYTRAILSRRYPNWREAETLEDIVFLFFLVENLVTFYKDWIFLGKRRVQRTSNKHVSHI